METMGKLLVSIDCNHCGFEQGRVEGENTQRCTECGRYASTDTDACCVTHEVRRSPYPSGKCPRCEQEQKMKAEQRHQRTRNPRVEPW
jgi:hypothetical protein